MLYFAFQQLDLVGRQIEKPNGALRRGSGRTGKRWQATALQRGGTGGSELVTDANAAFRRGTPE
jgi:hypothetical protein